MKCSFTCVSISLLFSLVGFTRSEVTCRDHSGNPVDWFIVYKLPKVRKNHSPWVSEGLGHFYMDVNSQNWKQSDVPLNETKHAIYYTLQQIYDNRDSKDVAYAMYNDEKPSGAYTEHYGHTKGALAVDAVSGFWLVHSLPRFPNVANASYGYPHSGLHYGQTFICVTYSFKTFNDIGRQLMYNQPWIYDSSMPHSYASKLPALAQAFYGGHVTSAPFNHSVVLLSVAGQRFTILSKASKFNADIYHEWMAPFLGSDLYSETWQNGVGKLYSDCSGNYFVKNVQWINFPSITFKETQDHAKWAVTTDADLQWTCIGDINRQLEQKRRGGGFVCCDLPKVWTAFSQIVSKVEPCQQPDPEVMSLL